MAACGNCKRERPVHPYAHHLGRRTSVLCEDCAASLTAIGMTLTRVERRVADEAIDHPNRRAFVAAWVRNLTARDNTGEVRAA